MISFNVQHGKVDKVTSMNYATICKIQVNRYGKPILSKLILFKMISGLNINRCYLYKNAKQRQID